MAKQSRLPIILVANNPFGHHLLTSQLLDLYRELDLDTKIVLLCNGVTQGTEISESDPIKVISFATKSGGPLAHINLLFKLIALRFQHRGAAYHLRGFVAGMVFWLSRLFILGSAKYIYDPRGAFFVEWREAGRSLLLSRLFGFAESKLIKHSVKTIVTSKKFGRLYERLFGYRSKYLTIYNSTSFAFAGSGKALPKQGPVRLVYLGTFNYWHDMDELCRVMDAAAQQIGPDRTEIFIYTSAKFHEEAQQKFSAIDCAALHIGYVNYHDIPDAMSDKHIGVSVVRPTLSTGIASPIKISDYVAHGLLPLLNSGIGDFDGHFKENGSAMLYRFGGQVDLSKIAAAKTAPNKAVYENVSRARSREKLAPVVERLLNG
ncbi:MAG: hypothetical protein ABJP34_02875 [Erythrobacter sp.]